MQDIILNNNSTIYSIYNDYCLVVKQEEDNVEYILWWNKGSYSSNTIEKIIKKVKQEIKELEKYKGLDIDDIIENMISEKRQIIAKIREVGGYLNA